MELDVRIDGCRVHHSVRDSFGPLLRDALSDRPVICALGPIYERDPAEQLLLPFTRSMAETGWVIPDAFSMAPDHVLEAAQRIRSQAIRDVLAAVDSTDLVNWTRSGLVLEVATRQGIRVKGRGTVHVPWRLRGTVTGRFGAEPVRGIGWTFNPLSLGPDDRWRIESAQDGGLIAAIDYKAMDVCSMAALVPGLREILGDGDPYERVAALTGLGRDRAKLNFLTWAYGGVVDPYVLEKLWTYFRPIHDFTCGLEHGEFPRMVQSVSAMAFRAGLSAVLPLLVTDRVRPLFTVHDELALDVSSESRDAVAAASKAMEDASTQTIGVRYRATVRFGENYEEVKK